MDPMYLGWVFAAVVVWGWWRTHRGAIVGAMRVPSKIDALFGAPRRVTLTVRRLDSRSAARASLTMREVAPDYDLDEGRMVAIGPRLGYPQVRGLLTPAQALALAGWLRTAAQGLERKGPLSRPGEA